MPKYYFDVTDAGNLTRDEVGVELNDDDVARDQAIGLLPAIARETFPDGDRHEIVVTARNEAGAVVHDANLTLHGRWWPGGGERPPLRLNTRRCDLPALPRSSPAP